MESVNKHQNTRKLTRIPLFIKFSGILIILLSLTAACFYQPEALPFIPDQDFSDIPKLLGYLFLLSLFVERAIEFVLSLWRSAGADRQDRKIEKVTKLLLSIPEEKIEEKKNKALELSELEDKRADYRAESRVAALWTGLVIGIVISLTGVRILGNIFSNPASSQTFHCQIFVLADVLLTGFVLAGGSESINRIMKLYNSFMDRATESNKMKTPD